MAAATAINLFDSFAGDSEFYAPNRTPSYAVKFIREAIENNPIVESQLLRHGLVTTSNKSSHWTSSNVKNAPVTVNCWKSTEPREVTYNQYHNGHTKTSLLREKLIQSKKINHSRPCSMQSTRVQTPSSIVDSDISRGVSYGFMVGARYTKHNFIQSSSDNYTSSIRSSINKSPPNYHISKPRTSSDSPLVTPRSPPNSPINQIDPETPKSGRKDPELTKVLEEGSLEVITKEDSNSPISMRKRPKTSSVRPKEKVQGYSIVKLVPNFSRKNLPAVEGFSINRFCPSSTSDYCRHRGITWSRAELNIKLSRSSRNMRNRRSIQIQNNQKQSPTQVSFLIDQSLGANN